MCHDVSPHHCGRPLDVGISELDSKSTGRHFQEHGIDEIVCLGRNKMTACYEEVKDMTKK